MPIYSIRDKNTGEVEDKIMSWASLQEFLQANPDYESIITKAPGIIGGTGDRTKIDGGFGEVLSKIASANPNSQLANTHGAKDSKSVAIRDSVQRVTKKLGSITE